MYIDTPSRTPLPFERLVDKNIAQYGFTIDDRTTWYELRDLLFMVGDTHTATLAQRHGVPLLRDAIEALRSSQVRDVYGTKLTAGEGSESLPDALSRMVQAACREYKVFTSYTKRFGLTETEKNALMRGVKQPRAGGGKFFARMKVKGVARGAYVQLLRNPAGPLELWAGGTTPADKAIRALVYQQLDASEGRPALATARTSTQTIGCSGSRVRR